MHEKGGLLVWFCTVHIQKDEEGKKVMGNSGKIPCEIADRTPLHPLYPSHWQSVADAWLHKSSKPSMRALSKYVVIFLSA